MTAADRKVLREIARDLHFLAERGQMADAHRDKLAAYAGELERIAGA